MVRPMRMHKVVTAIGLAVLGSPGARADVVPPQDQIACTSGEDIVVDHRGTRCEPRRCPTPAVCPPGWACAPRKETNCKPRARPCEALTVRRCQKANLPEPVCPRGTTPDSKRTAQLTARLTSHPSSQGLFPRLGRPLVVCYGDVREGVVQDDGAIVLQRDRPLPAQAARLAHLLTHLAWWAPFPADEIRTSRESCEEIADRAVAAEEEAHRIENDVRRSAGLPALPVEDLRTQYAQRCRELRRR